MRCVNATEVKYSMVRNSKENSTSKDTKSCIDTSRTGEQTLRRWREDIIMLQNQRMGWLSVHTLVSLMEESILLD